MDWLPLGVKVLLVILGYELARAILVGAVKGWLRRGAARFVRQHRVRLEVARFIDRVWMRERLAQDPEVEAAILEAGRRTGDPIPVLRDRVDAYVEEIAPYFSLATYYQFGAAFAKRFVNFCFELLVDDAGFVEQAAKVPTGAVRVYVINHRSNFDPLVLAFGLIHQIALSYAVGEWALVWPLSSLFRAFGGFFVRRGEPDPLYHAVLERFIQILAGHGAVTGFFVEGALSRDGALRRPRTGLLEYLVKLRKEFPEREIVFLPIGLNYDRVLEDRYLVAERDGKPPRPMFIVRVWNLVAILFWLPYLVAANVLRVAARSHQKFGYAAIRFGEPLRLTDFPGGATVHLVSAEERKNVVKELATELLYHRIAHVIPVTPVPIACLALLRDGPNDAAALQTRIVDVIAELRAAGAPFAFGAAFESIVHRRKGAESNIADLDREVLDLEEAELVLLLALRQLTRRRVVKSRRGKVDILEKPVVEYYANSVMHHLKPEMLTSRPEPAPRMKATAE